MHEHSQAPSPNSKKQSGLRILVLGVGGGAVIKQLHTLLDCPDITGIEYDATHLRVAKRWFGVDVRSNRLIHADAQQWLMQYSGEGFDIIIDDLFSDQCGEPVRAIPMSQLWSRLQLNNLKVGGMIIANFASRRELNAAKLIGQKEISDQFHIEHSKYENSIGVFLTQPGSVRAFRKKIAEHAALKTTQRRKTRELRIVRLAR